MKKLTLAATAAALLGVPAAAVSTTAVAQTPSGAPTAVLVQPDGSTTDFGTDVKGCLTAGGPVAWPLSPQQAGSAPFCRIDDGPRAQTSRRHGKPAATRHHR